MSQKSKLIQINTLATKNYELFQTCVASLERMDYNIVDICVKDLQKNNLEILKLTEETDKKLIEITIEKEKPSENKPKVFIKSLGELRKGLFVLEKDKIPSPKVDDVSPHISPRSRDSRDSVIGLSTNAKFRQQLESENVTLDELDDSDRMNVQIKSHLRKLNSQITEIANVNQKGIFEVVAKEVSSDHKDLWFVSFKVVKFDPRRALTKRFRTWSIDSFSRKILSQSGSTTKEHSVDEVFLLEKDLNNPVMLTLLFASVQHAYVLLFENITERQTFYECVAHLQRTKLIYCPKYASKEHPVARAVFVEKKGVIKMNVTSERVEQFSMICLSWYMNLVVPTENKALKEIISQIPDVFALALQKSPKGSLQYFQELLGKDYALIAFESQWMIKMIVFVKIKHLPKVSNIEKGSKNFTQELEEWVGTPKFQYKGCSAVSFKINETSFCFLSCDLLGQNNLQTKRFILSEIYSNLKLGRHSLDISQFDNIIWMGNFDFILQMNEEQLTKKITDCDHKSLIASDPLIAERVGGRMFSGFKEGEIGFLPTSSWNASKKSYDFKTLPSYTDRILYKSNGIVMNRYDSIPSMDISSHIPVYASMYVDTNRMVSTIFSDSCDEKCILIRDLSIIDRNESFGVIKKPQINIYGDCMCINPISSLKASKYDPSVNPDLKEFIVQGIKTINSSPDYLEHEKLVIEIMDLSRNVYVVGTAILPIYPGSFADDFIFSIPIEFGSHNAGTLRGTIRVKTVIKQVYV